jgi:hypothetical protein
VKVDRCFPRSWTVEAQRRGTDFDDADPHTIQLFWLLSGFAHSCLETGVMPIIIVRE